MLEQLARLIAGRELVFFVGAGISLAGSTRMPKTNALLHELLLAAAQAASPELLGDGPLRDSLRRAGTETGFEVTLEDLRQISPEAAGRFFSCFEDVEQNCQPNSAHRFLHWWLKTGGTVITTNYERLIERAGLLGPPGTAPFAVRYEKGGAAGFASWPKDLAAGGCLFKLHGSLANAESCLGALADVGIGLKDERALLLEHVFREHPVCVVGWRGVDPDIAPVLHRLGDEQRRFPCFWVSRPGKVAGPTGDVPSRESFLSRLKIEDPVEIDAEDLFVRLSQEVGLSSSSSPTRSAVRPDFEPVFACCSPSASARFLGIVLRRSREHASAEPVLGRDYVGSSGERRAMQNELAHNYWAWNRRGDKARARRIVRRLTRELALQVDVPSTFGLMSMTVSMARTRPWLLLSAHRLLNKHENALRRTVDSGRCDLRSEAVDLALYHAYLGRYRRWLLGWTMPLSSRSRDYVLGPFETARRLIDRAGGIHIHATIDVRAGRALALAQAGRCAELDAEITEIDRLCDILSFDDRTRQWHEHQRPAIVNACTRRWRRGEEGDKESH